MIADIIKSRIESYEPAATVRRILSEHSGKLLTEKIAFKITQACGIECTIRRQYGMCHLEIGKCSLILAHSEKNVYIDLDYFDRHNIAYFSAAEERNSKRQKALENKELILEVEKVIKTLLESQVRLKELLSYESNFGPDRYSIEKSYGLNVEGI